MSEKEVEQVVLRILKHRQVVNKKGGRKFVGLTKNAKEALAKARYGFYKTPYRLNNNIVPVLDY